MRLLGLLIHHSLIANLCYGQTTLVKFEIASMPAGYMVHPKFVLAEFSTAISSEVVCSLQCSFDVLCLHFVESDTTCSFVSKLVLARSAQNDSRSSSSSMTVGHKIIPPEQYDGRFYHHVPVVMHHASALFPPNTYTLNKFDITQDLYARADEMPNHNGTYRFELCYPELSSACFRWDQSSNPMDGSVAPAQGFSFKSGPPGFIHHSSFPFRGLLSDSRHLTMMDGVHSTGFYAFAVGSHIWAVDGGISYPGKLAGPISAPGTTVTLVQRVELYALIPIHDVEDVLLQL